MCVIPARYASTRLPGKPLVDLGGQSMIRRVYNAVQQANVFDLVKVATDDDQIFDHCMSFNIPVEMTSRDHKSGTDRVAEVALLHPEYEIIVNVQGDEPLIEANLLQELVHVLGLGQHQIVTAICPVQHKELNDVNMVKVVVDKSNNALYFSRSPIPFTKNKTSKVPGYRHVGTYGFVRTTLLQLVELPVSSLELSESLEQLRWLENGFDIYCIPGPWKGWGIDTQKDVDLWHQSYKSLH